MKSIWRAFLDMVSRKEDQPYISDADLAELRKRNRERAQEKIKELGKNWVCHPEYQRKTNERLQQTH